MSEDSKVGVLLIGLETLADAEVLSHFAGAQVTRVTTSEQFFAEFENWKEGDFLAIFAGTEISDLASTEVAQVLNSQMPSTPRIFITLNAEKYASRTLIKNGFESAFLIPADSHRLRKLVEEKILNKDRKIFKSVRMHDFSGESALGFDTFVYLPLNKKYVKYSSSGEKITGDKLDRLQKHKINLVHIDKDDMQKFYQYAAEQLKKIGSSGISETEKQEKLADSVRTLFSDIFDQSFKAEFETGKEMMNTCQGIISNYITGGKSGDWYAKIKGKIGESSDVYDHAANVSTFAALFSIGLNIGNPEDLAVAGLFHDLGLSQIDTTVSSLSPNEISAEQTELYYSHVEKSLSIVKLKKIVLSAGAEKAILQHHESYDGKGYPKQLPGGRISDEAQLLRFADEFDYFTRLEEGKPRRGPLDAFALIKQKGVINPDILKKLEALLKAQEEASSQAPQAS